MTDEIDEDGNIEVIVYGEPQRGTSTAPPWVVAKRKGNRIRWRNVLTGAWEPGWYPIIDNLSGLQERIMREIVDQHQDE